MGLASARPNNTSGDENHLCGASLRESHKISLKAQARHELVLMLVMQYIQRCGGSGLVHETMDKPPCSHLHAQKVDLPVMLIVDLNLASVVQYSPFQFHLSLVHEFVIQIACSV